jgi:uncharacterized cupredoxin-like copper-binding protein
LGDSEAQRMHEEQMMSDHDMHMDEGMGMAMLELAPGETKETTVTFQQRGTILYGCHEPGHYKGGMVGTVTVA